MKRIAFQVRDVTYEVLRLQKTTESWKSFFLSAVWEDRRRKYETAKGRAPLDDQGLVDDDHQVVWQTIGVDSAEAMASYHDNSYDEEEAERRWPELVEWARQRASDKVSGP